LLLAAPAAFAKKPSEVPGSEAPEAAAKVLVCHKNHHAISIAGSALQAHEAHGDTLVDDDNPCPSEAEPTGNACVEDAEGTPPASDDTALLAELTGPLFDLETGLLYLPQVNVDILGLIQTYAVILERINDTDFLVRHVEPVAEPSDDVESVEFDGNSTVSPFDVAVAPADADPNLISGVEFSVVPGCSPPQLSVTNFQITSPSP
jgi:hypothetical protein